MCCSVLFPFVNYKLSEGPEVVFQSRALLETETACVHSQERSWMLTQLLLASFPFLRNRVSVNRNLIYKNNINFVLQANIDAPNERTRKVWQRHYSEFKRERIEEFERKFHKHGLTDNSFCEMHRNKTDFDFKDILYNHIRSRILHP